MIGLIAFRHPQGPGNYVGLQPAIGIREKNPVARRCAGTHMTGVTLAEPAVWQHLHPFDAHPRILFRQASEDFARLVRGPVIHDDVPAASTPRCASKWRIVCSIRASSSRAAMTTVHRIPPLGDAADVPGAGRERFQRRQLPHSA